MSATDWDFAERTSRLPAEIKPKRDIVIGDGEKLTLGDTTVEFYFTPGHTPGTVSIIYPVKDGGAIHRVATWGGTGFNFELKAETFETYINSAVRYRPIVAELGADILLSNHTRLDGSDMKLPAMVTRKPGDKRPYVIGNEAVPTLRPGHRGMRTREPAAVEAVTPCPATHSHEHDWRREISIPRRASTSRSRLWR